MSIYTPTYLYIKQHSITGKLYFGKTTKNPETYFGSGKYWKDHIKKHGKDHVLTLWYCLFYDQESCIEFALNFSRQQNIVESNEWLNLKLENGLDGNPVGCVHSMQHKQKISKSLTGYIRSSEFKQKISNANKGKLLSESTKELLRKPKSTTINMCKPKSESHKNSMRKPKSEETKLKMKMAQLHRRSKERLK